MKSLEYAPDEEDMSQTEEHEFYSGLIIKIGARCLFCNQEGHFRMDCPLFWEAVKKQKQSKHKLALAAVHNTRNRQAEIDLKSTEAASGELPAKTVKTVMQVRSAMEFTGDKIGENCCRSNQQSEARLGYERNRATTEAGDREADIQ